MPTWGKWVLGCGALVVLVFGVGFAALTVWAGRQPREWHVEETVEIAAPPEQIYAALADLRRWSEWSAWARDVESGVTREYTGEGAGSSMSWSPAPRHSTSAGPITVTVGASEDGEEHGRGKVAITSADPSTGIAFDVTFLDKLALSAAQSRPTGSASNLSVDLAGRDFATHGTIKLEPNGATTRVTWSEDASLGEGITAGLFAAGGLEFIRSAHAGLVRKSLEELEQRMESGK